MCPPNSPQLPNESRTKHYPPSPSHYHHIIIVVAATLSLSFVPFVRQPPPQTKTTHANSFRERSVNSISSITSIHSLRTTTSNTIIIRRSPSNVTRHPWNHRHRRHHLQPFRPVRRHRNRFACRLSTLVWRLPAPVYRSSGHTCRSHQLSTIGRSC